MTDRPPDLDERLRSYLRTYDGRGRATTVRLPVRTGADMWRTRTPRRVRFLQATAAIACTTATFVLFAAAFAFGRSGTTPPGAQGVTGTSPHPTVTAPAARITCTTLPASAYLDLYEIAPDTRPAKVTCAAAVSAAEAACPRARVVCADVAPERADLSLLTGFGTIYYPPTFHGFRDTPVWMMSWPVSCLVIGPSMPGPPIGGFVQLPPTTWNGCRYVEFVDAANDTFLFSVVNISCFPWKGHDNAAYCDGAKQ